MAPGRHWSKPLTQRLMLRDGRVLVTLRDAGTVLTGHFRTARKNAPLEHAIELLMHAAETGRLADRHAATEQVALVLRLRRWI